MKVKKVYITAKDAEKVLEELYHESALTWEGLALESLDDAVKWIESVTAFKKEEVDVYITSGKVMNGYYSLTENNAYPDDLHIVSFKLSDIEDATTLAVKRFSVGGRWFDDIVNNNIARERIVKEKG